MPPSLYLLNLTLSESSALSADYDHDVLFGPLYQPLQ